MNENYVTLGQVCDKGSSNIAQKDLAEREGQYPIYGAAGLIKNVDFAHQKQPYIAVVKDGAGIGRVMKLPAYSSVIGTMQYIFPKENVDIDYLFYALQHMNLGKYFSGSTIPHIYFRDYQKERLKLPVMEVQQRQADTLSRIDALSAYGQRQIALMDEIVKSRFVEMFGEQKANPKGLPVARLSEVTDISLGLTHTPTYVSEGKPFLSVRDISSGIIDFSNCHYITDREFNSLPNGAKPREGDILFCRVGTIGKPVVIPKGTPEFGTFVSVGYLRKKDNMTNCYLKAWMENDYFMQQVLDNVSGASQINLNTGWLKNFQILLPDLEMQTRFEVFCNQVDKSKLAVKQSLEKLETLKKSLMQQYFG